MSQSIFHKICNQCMAQVPVDADACACGQLFEHDRASDAGPTVEILRTETEERLYEAYLEARVQQLMDALRAVREECGPGKWTPAQLERVRQALRAVESAKKGLTAQREKSAQASEAVRARKARESQRPAEAAAPATATPVPTAIKTATNAAARKPVPDMPSLEGFSATAGTAFRNAQAAKVRHVSPAPANTPQPPLAPPPSPPKTDRIPEFELRTEEYAIAGVLDGFQRYT